MPTRRGGVNHGEPIGQSGVTVGIGVDLGRRTESELVRLGLSLGLIARLRPYLGQRREAAQKALAACPLRLSEAEARQLNAAIASDVVGRVAQRYDAAAPADAPARPFAALPPAAQTVIASVAWQYGSNLPQSCPRLWSLVTRQDWAGAIAELEDFGDDYAPRRRQEAQLLREMLAADV